MDEFTDPEALAPLLDFVRTERNPDLRLAALAVAGRFRLDAAGWHEVAAATMALVDELAPGSPARGSALDLMASIPLGSVRNELRRRAQDPRGPDADHIEAALERVHDPSRARPLLARLRAGHDEVLALLAAMPLEDVGISPAEFPPADGDLESTLRLWRALALARVGDYAALDAFLSGEEATPPLFWGDPWSAYSALAAIAPIPDAMRIRLLEALPAVRRIDDAERCRMAELIVWAVTGSADAHGRPTEPAAPRAADRPDSTPAETGAARGDEAAAYASDAGAPFEIDEKPHGDYLRQLGRVRDILIDQTRALRKRWLIAELEARRRRGAYWGIGTRIEDYADPVSSFRDTELTNELASVPTRLAEFEPAVRGRLINWGYALCDAALRVRAELPVPAVSGLPVPAFPLA